MRLKVWNSFNHKAWGGLGLLANVSRSFASDQDLISLVAITALLAAGFVESVAKGVYLPASGGLGTNSGIQQGGSRGPPGVWEAPRGSEGALNGSSRAQQGLGGLGAGVGHAWLQGAPGALEGSEGALKGSVRVWDALGFGGVGQRSGRVGQGRAGVGRSLGGVRRGWIGVRRGQAGLGGGWGASHKCQGAFRGVLGGPGRL